MVVDHLLIEGRQFVLDSEDKLQEVTQQSGRPHIDNVSHCPDNGKPFKEGKKENLAPSTHGAHVQDVTNQAVRSGRMQVTVRQLKTLTLAVSVIRWLTDTFSNENSEGVNANRHTCCY